MIDLQTLTIRKLADMYRTKETTVLEVVDAYLKQIAEKNPELNAYLGVYDDVKASAEAAQQRIDAGDEGQMIGIPIALKDNILIQGKPVTAASAILENYVASYDAHVISKLKEAGVIFLGRTNLDEFAMGGSTENSAYGPTKNPHDTRRVAGGSSGGSAAAVASDMALVALGSDTGGSIRQPAAFCGVVGLKPTYGSVSRSGLMAMGSSLDVIGPLAKTVTDTEILFNTIKGKDTHDSTSHDGMREREATARKIIGVPRAFVNQDGIDKDVQDVFEAGLKTFEARGYTITDIDMPKMPLSLAVYYIIMPAEVSTNLSRFDGVKYGLHVDGTDLRADYEKTRGAGFGLEARRRILVGTYVLSSGYYDAYYRKAVIARQQIQDEFRAVFADVDVIAMPTSPIPAFAIGEKSHDPLAMYLADIFTVSANIAGIPGISLPAGTVVRNDNTLPVGLQLLAPHNHEDVLFTYGKDFLQER